MAQYYSLLTEIGAAQITNAFGLGGTVTITEFAVGTGENDAEYEPVQSQTTLKSEVYRGNVNSITTVEGEPNVREFHCIVPINIGGWTVREVGLFDDQNNLIVIAKYPSSYKPTEDEGTGGDFSFKIQAATVNAETVELKIDPAVVLATKKDIQAHAVDPDAHPHGHQIEDVADLQNALDGKSATGHGHQIADVASLQNALDGKSATGHGHQIADIANLQNALDGKSATGHGHQIADVANLQNALNGKSATGHGHQIADVANLQDILDRLVPVGSVISFAGTTPPSGWALCYGQELSRTDFADLFAAISTSHGAGNGSSTFNLPDHRGRVSAGKDNMGGNSANRLTGQSGGINGDVLGAVGGAERHTLTGSELPSNMDMTAGHGDSGTGSYLRTSGLGNFGNTTIAISLGNNTPHNNVQPTIVLNKIIKLYKGI